MADKGIPVDEQLLKNFLAKGGQANTQGGSPVALADILPELPEDKVAKKEEAEAKETEKKVRAATADEKAAKLHEKAEEQKRKLASQEEEAARKKAEAQAKQQEQENAARQQAANKAIGYAREYIDQALTPAKRLADRAASLRTTGGIGLLLVVILILLFTVVQVNEQGDTRAKQLWYMLNGRAALKGRKILQGTPPSSETITQDFQNLASAVERLGGDFAKSLQDAEIAAIENVPVVGGIFDFFRGLP